MIVFSDKSEVQTLTLKKSRSLLRNRESGQALVEVGLLLPMLVLLLLGVIELGRYSYIGILVANAARAGTAYGTQTLSQSVDTAGITTAARNDFKTNGQDPTNLAVTSTVSCGCDSGGTVTASACTGVGAGTSCVAPAHWVVQLSVTAAGTFNAIFNSSFFPTTITVTRTSAMRVKPV
jgi:Flp pilus assembly protein TadG